MSLEMSSAEPQEPGPFGQFQEREPCPHRRSSRVTKCVRRFLDCASHSYGAKLSPLRSEAVHVVWSDRTGHGAQLPPVPSPATVPNQPRMASPYLNLTKWHKFGPGPTFQLEPSLLFLPTPITSTEFALGNEENCPVSY